MAQTSTVRNPFLLMLNPEVVIAAMERSERLSGLNRHLCRPLDKAQPNTAEGEDDSAEPKPAPGLHDR
jgi:hypothetical protein